ncbi:MAG TPA: GNAT family N-acetyltransferase [Aquihabitans sp.]|nr:GNAT family N-acetyltransferase [Aquihabitans sp.]
MEAARPAVAADAVVVAALARQAIAELAANRGGSVWRRREAHPEPLDDLLAATVAGEVAGTSAVVGTVDDTVVGYGIVRMDPLHDGNTLAVVTDLYVDPEARAIGIGEAMMDLLVEQARAAGAIGIDALALPGDRHTKNFFETFGLTARAIVVHRSLVDPPATAAADATP